MKHAVMAACLLLSGLVGDAEAARKGIVGQPAPTWQGLHTWFQLPTGKKALDVSDFKGKVVYLYFFQSWCPGCHSRGFPTLKHVRHQFGARDDVVFVAVQTVFEGFYTNTAKKALSTVQDFGLDIPVAHDPGSADSGSVLMRRYRSGGTPWTILIDRKGIVRFNGFRLHPDQARARVESLLAEAP
ncbi:MAG: TlpA disulfide reductase family protein [Myxococcota bacterium]|nr:TlpA disulfide reductase family protein [Myxococcota bacterium]